jgi:uncharacterized protein YgfB (UPF0149 family)
LLTGRLAVAGVPAGPDWLQQVLAGTDEADALRTECQMTLDALYQATFWQLTERLSEFTPLLPDDNTDAEPRTLATEPLSDIIRDMLQITRAGIDEDSDDETNEAAYAEIVEYIRVAAQLAYEELSDIRHAEEK